LKYFLVFSNTDHGKEKQNSETVIFFS